MLFGLTEDGCFLQIYATCCHHGAYNIMEEDMENDIMLFDIYE